VQTRSYTRSATTLQAAVLCQCMIDCLVDAITNVTPEQSNGKLPKRRLNHPQRSAPLLAGLVELPGVAQDAGQSRTPEGVDPKVAADQRGHAIGLAIDTYTTTDLESRHQAVTTLEQALKLKEGVRSALTR
jgi:hypothetical protein